MTRTAEKTATEERAERRGRLKIGELSKLSGVGIEALRFYEKSGLLDRPARTEGGYRLYAVETLDRLAFIRRAQVLGFTLAEIKQIIAERREGGSPCAHVREIVRGRLKELDERMAEMRRYRRELSDALAEWDAAGDAEGHICGLIEGTEIEHAPAGERGIAARRKVKR